MTTKKPLPLFPFKEGQKALKGSSFDLIYGIFDRHGGISPSPYNSLNLSYNVGDSLKNVQTNRQIVKESLGVDILVSAGQVHGSDILVIEEKPGEDKEIEGYDALITNISGVALMIQLADCQSIAILDPVKKIVANIHCGWRGNVANLIEKTVKKMTEYFLCEPDELLAVISPSLGPCCAEFKNFQTELPPAFRKYQINANHFDLWEVSKNQLCRAGVAESNIRLTSICTKCDPSWFSYRREKKTGRFATVIGLINHS